MENKKDITKRLSKSKILSFMNCPLSYQQQQLFPEEFVANDAMKRGSEIHEMLENLYLKELDSPLESLATSNNSLRDTEEDLLGESSMNLTNSESTLESTHFNFNKYPELFDSEEKILERFSKVSNSDKYPKEIKHFIEYQKNVNFLVPESVEEKVYDKELDLVAMWDRVDFDGDKRCMIDYKTGRLKKVEDHKFELLLYAYIYMRKYKRRIDYVAIYFVDHGKFDIMPITDDDIEGFIVEYSNIKMEMEDCQRNDVWPAKKNWTCQWCSFKPKCPIMRNS
jgi:putative RecB family exonuclease